MVILIFSKYMKNGFNLLMKYIVFVYIMLITGNIKVFAADDMWGKAKSIMGDVYKQVMGISTVAAVVTASIALLLMNFSRSGKTVDESRAWLKRIVITWMILNGLGFIMAYLTQQFQGGQYTVSAALFHHFM